MPWLVKVSAILFEVKKILQHQGFQSTKAPKVTVGTAPGLTASPPPEREVKEVKEKEKPKKRRHLKRSSWVF